MSRTDRYLLALYIAEHRYSPPVQSGVLAEMVDRSPSAATEMLQRLADEGLVGNEPYDGAWLTDAGRDRAADLHETYVALSWFFREVLGLEAHEEEAMEMAGFVGRPVAERLVGLLLAEDADVAREEVAGPAAFAGADRISASSPDGE